MKTEGKDQIDMNEDNREDIIRAKQAISPDGLEDQSAEGDSGVGAEIDPKPLPDNVLEDTYMDGDEPAENLRMANPNRNTDKPDIDKPAYN